MKVKSGRGKTKYGPGVEITLSGNEVAMAIDSYLIANHIHVAGPRTITINGELCGNSLVYVDPSGSVIYKSKRISGRTGKTE